MTLSDYNKLAYDFAIRNSRVIELLEQPLTDNVVSELLTFGIYPKSIIFDDNNEIEINSFQELYLDYDHLQHLNHKAHSPYGEGVHYDEDTLTEHNCYVGHKHLIHPNKGKIFYSSEETEVAIERIKQLIPTAKLNQLERVFRHFDSVTFFDETIYSLDTSTNTKKTIISDIELVTKWVEPQMYLQLIPQYLQQ